MRLNWQAEIETPRGENGTSTETIILTRTPQRSGMDTPTLNENENENENHNHDRSSQSDSQASQASQLASKLRSLPSGSQSPYRVIRHSGNSYCISGESTPNGTIRLVARSRSMSGQFHSHPSLPASPSPSRSRSSSRHPSIDTSSLPSMSMELGGESSQSTLFSGMELPLSLRSIYSQTLSQSEELFSKSKKKSSQKRRRSSINLMNANKANNNTGGDNRNETVLPDDTGLFWDDEENVIYGREKVFSFSGYQLQMMSLLGLLYASARILRLDWVARDFEL